MNKRTHWWSRNGKTSPQTGAKEHLSDNMVPSMRQIYAAELDINQASQV
jgi:hypothetical protein